MLDRISGELSRKSAQEGRGMRDRGKLHVPPCLVEPIICARSHLQQSSPTSYKSPSSIARIDIGKRRQTHQLPEETFRLPPNAECRVLTPPILTLLHLPLKPHHHHNTTRPNPSSKTQRLLSNTTATVMWHRTAVGKEFRVLRI